MNQFLQKTKKKRLDFKKDIYLINIRDIPPPLELSPDDKMIFLIKGGGPFFFVLLS